MNYQVLAAIAACKEGTATSTLLSTYDRRRAALDGVEHRARCSVNLGDLADLLEFARAALAGYMSADNSPGDDLDYTEIGGLLERKIDLDAVDTAASVVRGIAQDVRYGLLTRRGAA